jgi:hypothetical protein
MYQFQDPDYLSGIPVSLLLLHIPVLPHQKMLQILMHKPEHRINQVLLK